LLSFDPASIGSALLDVDGQQPQLTGVASQLRRMNDLLSAPIDTLVQDSDEMKHLFEEIKPQLPKGLQIKLWLAGIFLSFGPKRKKLIIGSKHIAHRPPWKPVLLKGADWSTIRRQLWMPRLIPLRAPKDLNFWRESWKTSKRESEQPSGLSKMRKTS
jgi:hypothetical protein